MAAVPAIPEAGVPAAIRLVVDGDPTATPPIPPPAVAKVAFMGSGVSLFAPTALPSWWAYIKLVIGSLGAAAGGELGAAAAGAIAEALDKNILPPYTVTDVLARRLGSAYLSVMTR
jgi:hypothetical protein